jgi:signal recognition particle GTPase
MVEGIRADLLGRLAEPVGAINAAHPTRVFIDGAPAAGKTTLADELAVVLRTQGRTVIRSSTSLSCARPIAPISSCPTTIPGSRSFG